MFVRMQANVVQILNHIATKHAALLYVMSIMQLLANSLNDLYKTYIQTLC